MVAEWGVWYDPADPTHQAAVFASVAAELAQYPADQGAGLLRHAERHAAKSSLVDHDTDGAGRLPGDGPDQPIFQVSMSP